MVKPGSARSTLARSDQQAGLAKRRGEESEVLDEGFLFWAESPSGEMTPIGTDVLGRLSISDDRVDDIQRTMLLLLGEQKTTNRILSECFNWTEGSL